MEYTIKKCENGFLVKESYHGNGEHLPGKLWAFSTLDDAMKALPGLFEPNPPVWDIG